jgi:NAD(P)-dependent dehydrogenase (short-subunit alcohol dehydrogenase family)
MQMLPKRLSMKLSKVRSPQTRVAYSDVYNNAAGGKAVTNTSSATDGAAVIQSALDAFGGVTILINNAGILRDKGHVSLSV